MYNVIYEPTSIIKILTICSKTCDTLDTLIILCPCKYPFVTLKNGTTNILNDTHLIANPIVSYELPLVLFPTKICAIKGANINIIKNITIAINNIIFFPILYALSLASTLPKVSYSFITLLIAIGSPAEDISKNIEYIEYAIPYNDFAFVSSIP